MEADGQWWKDQLASDIHQALRIKELKLPAYRARSPQIAMRRYFADLLAILSNRYKLNPTTRHLAVYLLDLFMDHYDVAVKQLYIIALSCLLLASKFEEKEDRVPKLDQLNALGFMRNTSVVLNKRDLVRTELLLLDSFGWNLCFPTPAHFINCYLGACVQKGDLHSGLQLSSLRKSRSFVEKYAHYFLEVSLQDHAFLGFRPSQVAAACIAASRICLHISPSWTTSLHLLTGYSWDHLTPCIELMLLAHNNDVKEANKSKSSSVGGVSQLPQPTGSSSSQHQLVQSRSSLHTLQPPSALPHHEPPGEGRLRRTGSTSSSSLQAYPGQDQGSAPVRSNCLDVSTYGNGYISGHQTFIHGML